MDNAKKYCDYFDINETYFPCIDQSAINAGIKWDATYPHESFIEMLKCVDKMLEGNTKRSLWIHGAYGTGKSRCAYALREILEAPEEDVRAYWDKYSSLKKENTLLNKILGHKEHGVVTAYRYASGSITSPQLLFLAIQESVREALDQIPNSYKGENTLKESVIPWLEEPAHNRFINDLLKKPEWMSEFSQSTADEIIESLRKNNDVSGMMASLFKMADKEGITAFTLTADSLCHWIKDVINKNNTKIVLIWDEFSDYFRQNSNSLGEFQKIASLCEETHFYFIIVTHPISSLAGAAITKDDPMSVVQQRFNKVEIKMPSNIAFELIGDAFAINPAARKQWDTMTDDLYSHVNSSCNAVMNVTGISDPLVIKNMLPIHPMAALVLNNIASSFQSNQRSMFDFIKTSKDPDVEAFQWFIQNNGPTSDRPLLTIDMLWNFFYERGREYMSSDIKLILDTFSQQTNLLEKEKIVLKTILIMQAVDQRLRGGVSLLKPTEQNLNYAFEGDNPEFELNCNNIAKSLVNKGVLISSQLDGKTTYSVAILAGDGARIDKIKEDIRKNGSTSNLVNEGPQLATALQLTPALRLRFTNDVDSGALPIVTVNNFIKTMENYSTKDANWRFFAVLALAKTEEETQKFRQLIKDTIGCEQYKNITIIDALSTPLGVDEYEKYVEYAAMSQYYQGNNKQQSLDNARKAKDVLEHTWKNNIYNGYFIVWTFANQNGEKATGAKAVQTILQAIVLNRYRYVFDFKNGLSESQLKLTQSKNVARYGLGDVEIKGLIAGCEKKVLGKVWGRENYWEIFELKMEPISIIKTAVENMVEEAFKESGRISIEEIYDVLVNQYGFSPCNLTAFVFGFLLKEYKSDPYRCQDSEGNRESMTPDKLAEMIANCMSGKSKITYIVSLTDNERAFYKLTETVWAIPEGTCISPTQAGALIQNQMRNLDYPVWCLSEIDSENVFGIVKKYIDLVQSDGQHAHDIANSIGEIACQYPSCAQKLSSLLTVENCRKGMKIYLENFESGKLYSLVKEIGAEDHLLEDIKQLFSIQYSAQWNTNTGRDQICKLMTEYKFVKITNDLLNISDNNITDSFESWRNELKFIGISCEAICDKMPALAKIFKLLLKIAENQDILPDYVNDLVSELTMHNKEVKQLLSDSLKLFMQIYEPYLDGLSDVECEEIKNSINVDMFISSYTKSNAEVKKAADNYRRVQLKGQLYKFWSEKTDGTKNPRDWSERYKTPILCCIDSEIYSDAKKVFNILNSTSPTESEIKTAWEFLQSATFFDKISNSVYRDECFTKGIIGSRANLLSDVNEVRSVLDNMSIDVYDWYDSPIVRQKVKKLALAEYNAGGNESAKKVIDNMNDIDRMKDWLKNLIDKDMDLGIKIINNGGY